MRSQFTRVGVIGAGTMGISVTTDLLLHGIETVLIDVSDDLLSKARAEIIKALRFAPMLLKRNIEVTTDDVFDKILFTTDIRIVADCDFIIENVSEVWSIKQQVYRDLDAVCSPDVCFGMNTSCTAITQAGSLLKDPSRLVGVHFMNPVYLKKTVEVIKGFHTSDGTLQTLEALLNQLGKQSIVVNDLPGFVSNRISHLFMNEAIYVVQDQVAQPQQVDAIFKKCYGHTMGPLETADLIGLDTVMHSIDVLYESYQDSKFRCCPLLRKMVQAGNLGRKSGRGFYEYSAM
ncbi:3-hydroxyacyl-CoA dehydrogenase family protein [Mucilaginibacter sp. 21P]|uniref:3-hydroxyacyl-CoA dehydrogenase family protein n=1 Tax=Mucilaginibacter sp. 21P TaxID=2778902 RepID=UPI001C594381|nr:3-hydroxyacyl-CoA dehydrogenase family protein [Mucilaginibacter sp. 21P]QXV63893.1 3-hydroxyacyl-CoA dehydrogenase family protein [Mucilaginibacter sp. 21P]